MDASSYRLKQEVNYYTYSWHRAVWCSKRVYLKAQLIPQKTFSKKLVHVLLNYLTIFKHWYMTSCFTPKPKIKCWRSCDVSLIFASSAVSSYRSQNLKLFTKSIKRCGWIIDDNSYHYDLVNYKAMKSRVNPTNASNLVNLLLLLLEWAMQYLNCINKLHH